MNAQTHTTMLLRKSIILQDGPHNQVMPVMAMNMSHAVNQDLEDNLAMDKRGASSVGRQSTLTVSTLIPKPAAEAIQTLSNTLATASETITGRNMTIAQTSDLPNGDVAKDVIEIYSNNADLTKRQAWIAQMLLPEAQNALKNRQDNQNSWNKPACEIDIEDQKLSITVDASRNLPETVALIHCIMGNEDNCAKTEQVLQETPDGVNKLAILHAQNKHHIAALVSQEKADDLDMIVIGQRPQHVLVPYAA